jgi:hypothetical protein
LFLLDTVFLPEGWHHAVLNVGGPINMAVTHNCVIDTENIYSRLQETHVEFIEAYESLKRGKK